MDQPVTTLAQAQERLEEARRTLYALEGEKKALQPQRATIEELCRKFGVSSSREAVDTAIAQAEQELAALVSEVDQRLKAIDA